MVDSIYWVARAATCTRALGSFGDVNAVARGRIPQRLVRKALGRIAGGLINRLVR